jgi:ATP-dependent Zn protease
LLASDIDAFLGSDSGFSSLGSQTHEEFDAEVRRLLEEAEAAARSILTEQREILDEMATQLEDLETLEGKALEALVSRVPADPRRLWAVFGSPEGNGRAAAARGADARRA